MGSLEYHEKSNRCYITDSPYNSLNSNLPLATGVSFYFLYHLYSLLVINGSIHVPNTSFIGNLYQVLLRINNYQVLMYYLRL